VHVGKAFPGPDILFLVEVQLATGALDEYDLRDKSADARDSGGLHSQSDGAKGWCASEGGGLIGCNEQRRMSRFIESTRKVVHIAVHAKLGRQHAEIKIHHNLVCN